jgi:hypothetical protein
VSKSKSSTTSSARERARALPWVAIAQTLVAIGARWRAMSQKDRARLGRLLRESRGWPGKLSRKQRAELRALLAKLDLRGVGDELLALRRRRTRGRRSRRRSRRRARA